MTPGKLRFLFKRDPGLVSRIIQLVDGGPWSHVAVGIEGDGTFFEAVSVAGVRERRVDDIESDPQYADRIELLLGVPDVDAARSFARDHLGDPYDYGAIAELALRRVFGVAPHIDARSRFFCDELAIWMTQSAGVPLFGPEGEPLAQPHMRAGVHALLCTLHLEGAELVEAHA